MFLKSKADNSNVLGHISDTLVLEILEVGGERPYAVAISNYGGDFVYDASILRTFETLNDAVKYGKKIRFTIETA